ncbi:MAG: zinc ribbon domain-containing protein [Oscillospiraceae bacterium]|jgi:hypothetical protein|nr:zinc ribbon domain-containing protein [Oscillospiraceae bacterium]
MKCKVCGADLPDGAKFCGNCSSPVEQSDGSAPSEFAPESRADDFPAGSGKKSFLSRLPVKPKTLAIGAGGVVVLVLVIVLLASLFKGGGSGNYVKRDQLPVVVQSDDDEVTYLSGKTEIKLDGELYTYDYSLDGKVTAALVKEEDSGYSDPGTLYFISGGKSTQISDDVYSFSLADSGSAVAFITDRENSEGTLNYSTGGKGKAETIASEGVLSYVISTDGKTVGYTADYEDGDFTGYIWNGKKSEKLDKNASPNLISDGGKYIYYTKNSKLYVKSGKGDALSLKEGSITEYNSDGTEVIYSVSGTSYISVNGKEGKKLRTDTSVLIPDGYSGVKSFKGVAVTYNDGDTLGYLNKKLDTPEKIDSSIKSPFLCKDGKTVLYIKKESVYRVNASKSGAKPVELCDDDVYYFAPSLDGKSFYYSTTDKDLKYQTGSKSAKGSIAELDSSSDFAVFYKTGDCFYIEDDELYVSKNGGKGTKVSKVSDDVYYVYADSFWVYIDGDSAYISSDGKNFTEFDY